MQPSCWHATAVFFDVRPRHSPNCSTQTGALAWGRRSCEACIFAAHTDKPPSQARWPVLLLVEGGANSPPYEDTRIRSVGGAGACMRLAAFLKTPCSDSKIRASQRRLPRRQALMGSSPRVRRSSRYLGPCSSGYVRCSPEGACDHFAPTAGRTTTRRAWLRSMLRACPQRLSTTCPSSAALPSGGCCQWYPDCL